MSILIPDASGDLICSHWHHPVLVLISRHSRWLTYWHPQVYFLSRLSAVLKDGPAPWWHTHTNVRTPALLIDVSFWSPPVLLLNESGRCWTADVVQGLSIDGADVTKVLLAEEAWVSPQWVWMRETESNYQRLNVFLSDVHMCCLITPCVSLRRSDTDSRTRWVDACKRLWTLFRSWQVICRLRQADNCRGCGSLDWKVFFSKTVIEAHKHAHFSTCKPAYPLDCLSLAAYQDLLSATNVLWSLEGVLYFTLQVICAGRLSPCPVTSSITNTLLTD